MKRDELVDIKHNDIDKRCVNVIMTAKGRQVLRQTQPVAREIVDKIMLSISERDTLLLENSLRVMRQNAHCCLESLRKSGLGQSVQK